MRSDVLDTQCDHCGRTYESGPEEPYRCDCGGPLELREVDQPSALPTGPIDGLGDFADALPDTPLVDIGAGGTPLVKVEESSTYLKLETCNPTGSFKDRGASTTITRARSLGVEYIKEDSSGNAGLAIATHAARADIDATIFVPASATGSTLSAIRATGADVRAIEGDRTAVADAAREADAGWYASHAWRPEFYEGTATLAWELIADLDGDLPDAVVLPVGHGTLFLGMYRGFSRLATAGLIEDIPRLYAAQLRGAGSLQSEHTTVDGAIAPGIRIAESARATQVKTAIDVSDGAVVPIDPAAVQPARDRLARTGFDACTTAAVAMLARERLADTGVESDDSTVVVVMTGRARDR